MKTYEQKQEATVGLKTGEIVRVLPGKDCYQEAGTGKRIEYGAVAWFSTEKREVRG